MPWVVYQVNAGMPSPTFFAFVSMRTLAQNDDLLNLRNLLPEAEGEAAERMQQSARAEYNCRRGDVDSLSNIPRVGPLLDGWSATLP